MPNGDWELEEGYEDAFSSTKGYPRTCTFHEGRLFFGGSASEPLRCLEVRSVTSLISNPLKV